MVIIFMLIVGITMKITKINCFCGIPDIIQAFIHHNSKFRFSLGHDIAKNRGKTVNFEAVFRSKSSLKYPLNVRKVCARFPDKERK